MTKDKSKGARGNSGINGAAGNILRSSRCAARSFVATVAAIVIGTSMILPIGTATAAEPPSPAPRPPFEVTNTDDSGPGSLRSAMISARAAGTTSEVDVIVFRIPQSGMIAPIVLETNSPLPPIDQPLFIDGWSQGGPDYAGPPLIEVSGEKFTLGGIPGLFITGAGGNSRIRGLAINGFPGPGIEIRGAGGNVVEGNFIGTDLTGAQVLGNRSGGVWIQDSADNVIGGTTGTIHGGPCSGSCNLIAGNGNNGIFIGNGGSTGNRILGNFIGTDVSGKLLKDGSGTNFGNTVTGILVSRLPSAAASGSDTIIGGAGPAGNVISGNGDAGVQFWASHRNKLFGNNIGTDATGTVALPNRFAGVSVFEASNNEIGSPDDGTGNTISGNAGNGVEIVCGASTLNTVVNNAIGINSSKTAAIANGSDGVLLTANVNNACVGAASENIVGPGNTISGNFGNGIEIAFGAAQNRIRGNFIGTTASNDRRGNGNSGIAIFDSPGTKVGGTDPSDRNVIGDNAENGVLVGIGDDGNGSDSTVITGNFIGTGAPGTAAELLEIGNGSGQTSPPGDGIAIVDSQNVIVGGIESGAGNEIAFNAGAGVSIRGDSSSGNTVRRNSIHTNEGLGIDIGGDGEDLNDGRPNPTDLSGPVDQDAGPNGKQNTPEISTLRTLDGGAGTKVTGFLNSPDGTYTVDVYRNSATNGHLPELEVGEGKTATFNGPITVKIDDKKFDFDIAGFTLPAPEFLTITATDSNGNTSEFSHDADNDALYDTWEMNGIDGDGDGNPDYNLPEADEFHKDIYVEVDSMEKWALTDPQFGKIKEAFANAPYELVLNPDATKGVNLHIDNQSQLDRDYLTDSAWATDWDEFHNLKSQNFAKNDPAAVREAKRLTHRYAIIGRTMASGDTGLGELIGNDFYITLAKMSRTNPGGTSKEREGTFMHELGHTLGLKHGGADHDNYKPNYHSVMNYTWVVPEKCLRGWALNYSEEKLPSLNEDALDEEDGIGGSSTSQAMIGPPNSGAFQYFLCDRTTGEPNAHRVDESGPVDWDGNSTITSKPATVPQDANWILSSTLPSPHDILDGHEDWSALIYNFREEPEFDDGYHGPPIPDERPVESLHSNWIDVLGNDIPIPDGDLTSSQEDGTEFGSTTSGVGVAKSFSIVNYGDLDLTLTGDPLVDVVGTDAADFVVTSAPAGVIPAGGATTFQIRFQPSTNGTKTATVKIASDAMDDFGKELYEFAITGTGEASSLSPAFASTSSGRNVALLEAGTTVVSFSGQAGTTFSPQNMLNYSPTDNPWRSATGQTSGQYTLLQLAAEGTYLIDRIRLMPESISVNRVKDFAIDVSTTTTDPAAFTTVLTATAADNATLQDFQLPQPTAAKYVKYRPLNNRGGTQIGTRQLKIMTSTEGGSEVGFHDRTASPDHPVTAWSWQFGDGTSSTEQNPAHTYAAPGTYNVTLVVTDSTGQTSTVTHTQRVLAPPTATINHAPAEPDEGQLITFSAPASDPDGGPIVWLAWDWGDGSTPTASSPAGATFTHRYFDSLSYPVTLVAVDAQEQKVEVQRTVTPRNLAPTATFTAPRIAAQGQDFTLQMTITSSSDAAGDVGTLQFAFDCGDGYGPAGSDRSASCPSTGTPTYPVRGKVIDKEGAFSEYTALVTTASIALAPADTVALPGQQVPLTATVRDTSNQAVTGLPLRLTVTGDNPSVVSSTTNTTGVATFNVTGPMSGMDTAAAKETFQTATSNTVTITRRPASQADVLILGTTVTSPTTSVEVRQALAAGFTIEVVGAKGWRAKTSADFARYKSIILGDYATEPGVGGGTYDPALDTRSVWGPAVTGNVYLISADVASQAVEGTNMDPLVNRAIRFTAAEVGHTGMYVTVRGGAGPLLDPFGEGFQFETRICGPSHIVAPAHPAMSGLTDADLPTGDNECQFGFHHEEWPSGFESLAVEIIPENPTFPGISFILARGPVQAPPGTIAVSADASTGVIGQPQTAIATAANGDAPAVGAAIRFNVVSGPHAGRTAEVAAASDGTAAFTYTGTDVGTDAVEASFVDARGATVTSNPVTVTWQPPPNAAPTSSAGSPQTAPEGAVVTLDGSASTDPEGKPLTFNWEVTSTSPGAPPITISPATSAKPTFTAADDGQYTIRLTVADPAGATGTAETTVTVTNVGPEVMLVVADNHLHEGEAVSGSGSFTDPGSDQWTAIVDYGDGSGVQPLPLTPDKTFTIAHTYAAPGEFVITTCVTDDDGGRACANSTLAVAAVYAMYTRKDTCGAPASIDWGGSRGRVAGDVHANGGLRMGGSNNVINGSTTYRCDQVITGKGNKLSGGLNPVISAPPPHSPTRADFTCTYTATGLLDLSKNGPWWANGKSSSGTLVSGTICADEIKLGGSGVKGKVTLVATKISISASSAVLTPFDQGVIAFATGNSTEAIRIESSNSSHAGALIAPSGGVVMGGARNTISAGGVDAWTINISGSDWKIAR